MLKKIGDYLEIHALSAQTEVSFDAERNVERAVISGSLNVHTPVKVLYMASLELDGVEMYESFRLTMEPGETDLTLPQITVINPIRSNGANSAYTLTLKIYASGGVVHDFSTEVRF